MTQKRLFGLLATITLLGIGTGALLSPRANAERPNKTKQTITQAQTIVGPTANTFSGQATGVIANVSVLGAPLVNTTIAQTDPLPPAGGAGGNFTKQVLSASVPFGPLGASNFLTTGIINTMTSGGSAAGTPDSSQSQAQTDTLNALLLGNTISADVVRANTVCTCTDGVPNCTGSSTITNLRINGVNINVATTTSVPLVDALGVNIGSVLINEQTSSGTGQTRAITVNALHIVVDVPGTLLADIIISQAYSDIVCGGTATTCTPTTTVTEGDLFPGGISTFGVTSGPNSVTVDHINAGTGLRSLTVAGTPINAVVTIPAFTPGTYDPVTVTFTAIDPSQPVDFTLRAASSFHAAFIRVRCSTQCTPTPTVTEGDLFPGGISTFGVTGGPGFVTVDHINAGTGLRSLTVVSATNVIVTIPAFIPGTYDPVTVTYTAIDPSQPIDFTLRAASSFHAAFIRVRCSTTLNTFSGRATAVNANIAGINATLVDTGELPASGGIITATPLLSANVLGGALTTGALFAETQGAGDQSRSQATVASLNLEVGGNTITAGIVSESSQCTCTANGPVCAGSAQIGTLVINGTPIAITGEPNQRVNLPGGGYVVINEQILTGSGNTKAITANGLHVFIPPLIPGAAPVADVIISSAHSDIVCQ